MRKQYRGMVCDTLKEELLYTPIYYSVEKARDAAMQTKKRLVKKFGGSDRFTYAGVLIITVD